MRQSNQAQHDQPQTARPTHRSAQPTTRATSKGAFDENTTGVLMVASSQGWDDRGPAGGGESNKGGNPAQELAVKDRRVMQRLAKHQAGKGARGRVLFCLFVLPVCFCLLFCNRTAAQAVVGKARKAASRTAPHTVPSSRRRP